MTFMIHYIYNMLQIYWLPSHKVSQGELWALGTLRFRLSQFQQDSALDSVLPGLVYGSLRLSSQNEKPLLRPLKQRP